MSYTRAQEAQKVAIRKKVQVKYPCLSEDDYSNAFDMAVGDYLSIRYPSYNGRPSVDSLNFDNFFISQWLFKRILDILERVGMNITSYSENGLHWTYASGNIDPILVSQIMPKAGVPK